MFIGLFGAMFIGYAFIFFVTKILFLDCCLLFTNSFFCTMFTQRRSRAETTTSNRTWKNAKGGNRKGTRSPEEENDRTETGKIFSQVFSFKLDEYHCSFHREVHREVRGFSCRKSITKVDLFNISRYFASLNCCGTGELVSTFDQVCIMFRPAWEQ